MTGQEVSAVLGFTYNFENRSTQYQNGVDAHLDWARPSSLPGSGRSAWSAISTISSPATAAPATGSAVSSRAIGPQIGYIIPLGDLQGYVNLKGYKEFSAAHRPEGWNVWLTFVVSPAAATPQPPRPRFTK